jgi:hypothetical protein
MFSIIGYNIPTEIKLINPSNSTSTSEIPKISIKLNCTAATYVWINNSELSVADSTNICNETGYNYNLKDGENKIAIMAKNSKGDKKNLDLTINFDQNSYDTKEAARIAEEKAQAEILKVKKAAEEKAAADAKAIADSKAAEKAKVAAAEKAAAEIKIIADWKGKFQTLKNDKINNTTAKSDEMINFLANSTNSYNSRTAANNYKSYFNSLGLGNAYEPVPDSIKADIENLKKDYQEYTFANYCVATEIVDYFNASSVEEQYNKLDMIKSYMQDVANYKYLLQLDVSLIEEKLK